MSIYVKVDRGTGPRAGQLLRRRDDPKRWQGKVFLFRDERGRKRYRTEVVHGNKRDAETRLLALLQTKSTGSPKARSSVTVRELAREWHWQTASDVSARTYEIAGTHG